jgi:phosphoserine aminotransferase
MGMPPGLGVMIVKKSLLARFNFWKENGMNPGAHHTYSSFHKNYESWETPSTPNVMAIYCLNEICKDYNRIGIDNMCQQAYDKEILFHELSDSFLRISKENTSLTVKTFAYKKSTSKLLEKMSQKGYQVSSGYGIYKESQIRLANFPALSYDITAQMIHELNDCDRHL